MRRNLYILIIVIIIIILLMIILIRESTNKLIFYPLKDYIYDPEIPHEKSFIQDYLSAWYFNNFKDSKTILFCPGNYGNASYYQAFIDLCYQQKYNLLIIDYAGYGKSLGSSNQEQVYKDGEAAYDYLVDEKNIDPNNIILWGYSLGGAVATHVATKRHVCCLLLMSTFSSLDDIPSDNLLMVGPVGTTIVKLLTYIVDNMESKNKITRIKCPIILMHSLEDDLIPYANAIRLYNSIQHNNKKLYTIGGSHIQPTISSQMLNEIFNICQ
jgi:uncharacterized protein